jgi:hypothetical protein
MLLFEAEIHFAKNARRFATKAGRYVKLNKAQTPFNTHWHHSGIYGVASTVNT